MTCLEIIEMLQKKVPDEAEIIIQTVGNIVGVQRLPDGTYEFVTD